MHDDDEADHLWKVCKECEREFAVRNNPAGRRRKYCGRACAAEVRRRKALDRYHKMLNFDFGDDDES